MSAIPIMQIAVLALIALAGTGVVLTRDPPCQIIGVSFFGLLLAVMFFILQAPDVALSQIVIGAVALPLMVLLALAKLRRDQFQADKDKSKETKGKPKQSGFAAGEQK
jgi:energy-converting hydrogenase B subunit D